MNDSSNSSSQTKKPVRPLILLLFNLVLFIVILYGFEIYLRLDDPRSELPVNGVIEDPLDPSKKSEYTWGHLVKYNRFKFRERDFEMPKPAGVYRIMVLGDSFTFGVGLSVDERYTKLLEDRLNIELPGKTRYEVLNFGVEGIPTRYEREILTRAIEPLQPDLIVIGFTVNDPCLRGEENTIEKEEFDKRWRGLIEYTKGVATFVGLKRTGESFETATYRVAHKLAIIPKWQDAIDRSYERNSAQWKTFVSSLTGIKKLSDDAGLPRPIFAILTQPAYLDRPTDYSNPDKEVSRYIKWYDQAEVTGKDLGFRTFNYKKEFIERFSNEYVGVNSLDRHPSAKLNILYSEKLFKIIKNEYLGPNK